MKRSASEILRNLESRIARLEKQAGSSRELVLILEKVLHTIKRSRGHGPMTNAGVDTYTTYVNTLEGSVPDIRDGYDNRKTVSLSSGNYARVYLDEAMTPSICSRIKSKIAR